MLNILIVDDDEDILESYLIALRQTGFSIITSNNPVNALEIYRNGYFDAVITDIRMPVMSGIELKKKIREINNKAIIILISAFLESENMTDPVQNDIGIFLQKPINIRELIITLRKVEQKIYKENK